MAGHDQEVAGNVRALYALVHDIVHVLRLSW